jgi:hypothetical protein
MSYENIFYFWFSLSVLRVLKLNELQQAACIKYILLCALNFERLGTNGSRDSAVSEVTEQLGFGRQGKESSVCHGVQTYSGVSPTGSGRSIKLTTHPPPRYSAAIKTAWSCTSRSPYVFIMVTKVAELQLICYVSKYITRFPAYNILEH